MVVVNPGFFDSDVTRVVNSGHSFLKVRYILKLLQFCIFFTLKMDQFCVPQQNLNVKMFFEKMNRLSVQNPVCILGCDLILGYTIGY